LEGSPEFVGIAGQQTLESKREGAEARQRDRQADLRNALPLLPPRQDLPRLFLGARADRFEERRKGKGTQGWAQREGRLYSSNEPIPS
jgi:hypothetical protein